MTKKDIFVLLLPCIYLLAIAVLAMSSSEDLFLGGRDSQWYQQKADEMLRKVQAGQLHPKTEDLVDKLGRSYVSKVESQEILARAHARMMMVIGYCGCGFTGICDLSNQGELPKSNG